MEWIIIFYQKENGEEPVVEYMNSLPTKHQAKVAREIDLLEEFGIELQYPHTKDLEGDEYKGLYELRIKFSNSNMRIFYFLFDENKFVLVHGFTKKSYVTPKRELQIAKTRMEDYKRRKFDK
jgi:phage-related protein